MMTTSIGRKDKEIFMFGGIASHVMCWIKAAAGYSFSYWKNPSYKESSTTHPIDICLIHGTADFHGSFEYIVKYLLKNGLPETVRSIHAVIFPDRFTGKSIETFSWDLAAHMAIHKMTHVYLAGHSRGSLVAGACALRRNLAHHNIIVCGIFSICSPWRGSDWALTPVTKLSDSVNEMRSAEDNLYIDQLSKDMSASSIPVTYIAGANDWIVPPAYACPPEKKESLIVIPDECHLSITSCGKVAYLFQESTFEIASRVNPPESKPVFSLPTIIDEYFTPDRSSELKEAPPLSPRI